MNKLSFLLQKTVSFALLASMTSVFSQTTIYGSDQYSEYSIIRNYDMKPKVDITFNVICADITFNYVDRGSSVVYSADVSNYIQHVNDFVVYDGFVFFCGYGGGNPLYGFFDIQDVFFNGGYITLGSLNAVQAGNDNVVSFSPTKIDARESLSGDVHIIMTGSTSALSKEGANTNGSRGPYDSAIMDVVTSIPTTHTCFLTVDTEDKYIFDDVILTEKYAVVSARGKTPNNNFSHDIFSYLSPTMPWDSYFHTQTSLGNDVYQMPVHEADASSLLVSNSSNDICLAKMEQDGFATICNNDATGRMTLSTYNDPSNNVLNRKELPFLTNCREFTYIPRNEDFAILSSNNDYLYYTKYPYTDVLEIKSSAVRWLSLDKTDADSHVILSGFYSAHVDNNYWIYDDSDRNGCIDWRQEFNNNINPTDIFFYVPQEILRGNISPERFQPNVNHFNLNIQCNE